MTAREDTWTPFVYRVEDHKGPTIKVLREILQHIRDGYVVEIKEDRWGDSVKMKRADL